MKFSTLAFLSICLTASIATLIEARSISKRQAETVFECSFENTPELCEGSQYGQDDFDWSVHSGPTQSEKTGPSSAIDGQRYLYIEASNPRRRGDAAVYLFPQLPAGTEYCVHFCYNMYGFHINTLKLVQLAADDTVADSLNLWAATKDQGQDWLKAEVTVQLQENYNLGLVGVVGNDFSGDIAVDDIVVKEGRCAAPESPEVTPPSGPETNSTNPEAPSALLFDCSFETTVARDVWCNMLQSRDDDFDWSRKTGTTKSEPTGPRGAFEGLHYIYIEASSPRRQGDEALIFLPTIDHEGSVCVRFAYNMFGYYVSRLEVAKLSDNALAAVVWEREGQQGNAWFAAEVDVNIQQSQQVGFLANVGNGYSGDIALDAISVSAGPCERETPENPEGPEGPEGPESPEGPEGPESPENDPREP